MTAMMNTSSRTYARWVAMASLVGLAGGGFLFGFAQGGRESTDDEAAMIRARTRWFEEPRAFPSERMPEGGLERAWMERLEQQRSARALKPQATGILWRSLGPAP